MRNRVRLETIDLARLRGRRASRACDVPGCVAEGEHRAPKARTRLREYYWFCLAHVQGYNAAWNYHAGLTPAEVEAQVWATVLGDRPLWPLGQRMAPNRRNFTAWQDEATDPYDLFREERAAHKAWQQEEKRRTRSPAGAEDGALASLGLAKDADAAAIKKQYKRLVKRYHPDANGGDKAAEEQLKRINEAYNIVKKRLVS